MMDPSERYRVQATTNTGIPLEWLDGDRSRRAELFRAKLRAFFDAGGAGYFLWNYDPLPDSDQGFDAADPVMGVIREASDRLGPSGP